MGGAQLESQCVGPDGAPTLVFIHGYPDTAALWDDQVSVFKKSYRCVTLTMPLYDGEKNASKWPTLGCNFDETTRLVAYVIRKHAPGEKVTLVVHDWGCIWGGCVQARHPELVHGIALMDVGPLQPTFKALLMMGVAYQYMFIFIWLLSFIPKVGFQFATRLHVNVLKQGAVAMKEKKMYFPDPDAVSVNMLYPYFWLHFNYWLSLLTFGILGQPVKEFFCADMSGESKVPSCPTLFLWGKRKALMFHDKKWSERNNERKDGSKSCKMITGHWIMKDDPEQTNAILGEWLADVAPVDTDE